MTHFEEMQVLDSMEILVDTREQSTPKAVQRYNSFGVPYTKTTLAYGDYAANFTLLDGRKLYDISKTVNPLCIVERKMNLDELAQCFTYSRERFEREFQKAKDNNSSILSVRMAAMRRSGAISTTANFHQKLSLLQ